MAARKAIGVVRVSQTKGRDGESFHSPQVQRQRIRAACEAHGWDLLEIHDELDVSGGKPLADRPGLRQAVESVEAGTASVVVGAYLDRLTRDPRVRDEAIDRVEAAGGEVFAADMGRQTNGTAVEQLTGTLASAVHRYVRRVAAERSADAQKRAVERGVVPWPNIPPGYVRAADGTLAVDPKLRKVIAEAFTMRAAGNTIAEVRAHLARHGVHRSYHGTQAILISRVYIGEIRFGKLHNTNAHDPIITPDVFDAAQRMTVSRGRRAKSERLLARLGILRCASCGSRMTVGTQRQHGRTYPFYRCASVRADCDARATVSAEMVEQIITDTVRRVLADAEGRASVEASIREAENSLASAQAALDSALRAFEGFMDEAAARERLTALRDARDAAREQVEQVGDSESAVKTINANADWDLLTHDERRDLIRAVIANATVAPGRGPDRIAIKLVGE